MVNYLPVMRTAAWCATAAVLAASLGAYAGILVGERDADRSPVALHVTPDEVEACGEWATLTADLTFDEREPLTIRLLRLDDEGHEHVIRVVADPGSLDLPLAVPAEYSAPDGSAPVEIVGRHLVRLERRDELLALGTVDVQPEDPATPSTC